MESSENPEVVPRLFLWPSIAFVEKNLHKSKFALQEMPQMCSLEATASTSLQHLWGVRPEDGPSLSVPWHSSQHQCSATSGSQHGGHKFNQGGLIIALVSWHAATIMLFRLPGSQVYPLLHLALCFGPFVPGETPGFGNYRYFCLFLLFLAMACLFIVCVFGLHSIASF